MWDCQLFALKCIYEMVTDLQVDKGTAQLTEDRANRMTTDFNSGGSNNTEEPEAVAPKWLKVGAVAAASGILGGLAAAWYFRKTLAQLREDGAHDGGNPVSGNHEDQDYDI